MNAYLLTGMIEKIHSDEMYLIDRRVLHENYEWLENFWRYKYNNGDNSINNFISEKAKFFWAKNEVSAIAASFATNECVGSNSKINYCQNQEIGQATMYLRFFCDLFVGDVPDCNSIPCRNHKLNTGFCTIATGRQWKSIENDSEFSFKALMYIIRQIRNNLFHGHKMTLEPEQFARDKYLVSLAGQTTSYILQNLIGSGG